MKTKLIRLLSTGAFILMTTMTGRAQTAQQDFDQGINYLTATNLDAANLSFSNAVVLAPSDPTNNFFYALTSVATLADQPAGSAFLSSLGVPETGRSIYHWTTQPPKENRQLVAPVGVNADAFTAQLRTNVLPALTNAEANLAAIVGPRFSVTLTPSETHLAEVTVDYGDVLMMQSMVESAVFSSYETYSWNVDAQLTDVSTILTKESAEALLTNYPQAFTVTTTNDLAAAKGAFTNAINFYLAASEFIRVDRPPGVVRLFNLPAKETNREFQFRETLTNILASLTGPPVTLTANTNFTVSAAAFFDGSFAPRSFFPAIEGNEFVWGSFPDTTLGGVVTGFNQEQFGRVLEKYASAEFEGPGVDLTTVYAFTNSTPATALALNTDGNFYVAEGPYFDGYSANGSIGEITPSGVSTTFYIFGAITNDDGDPLDGADPNALVASGNGTLYGTTLNGGTSFTWNTGTTTLDYQGQGTVFKLTTNGILTTVYTFNATGVSGYQTNTYYNGSGYATNIDPILSYTNGAAPTGLFILGADGNFYGTTSGGGSNNSGTVFKVTPAGAFATVYQIGADPDDGGDLDALAVTAGGTIYASSPFGGDNGIGAILKINPSGSATTLYSFGTEQDQFGNALDGIDPLSIILGADGSLYGDAQLGGTNQSGTVFRITPGGSFRVLYSFDESVTNGAVPTGAMVQARNGVLYGATLRGGANQKGTIFSLTTNGVASTAAWFDQDTGSGLAAGLNLGFNGTVYGATGGGVVSRGGTIFTLLADSFEITPLAGFDAIGPVGGPFVPSSENLVLTNVGKTPLTWSATSTAPWLSVSSSGGVLAAGGSVTIGVNLTALADSLPIISKNGAIVLNNITDGISQTRQFTLSAGDGGFEDGTFQDWILGGDTNYTFVGSVLNWPGYVHSGGYAALLGTSGQSGTLSQAIPTVAGQSYVLSLWLDNPEGGDPNHFLASWGGQMLFAQTNLGSFGWSNMQFTVTATGATTLLEFNFEQDYDYFGLDDIQLIPASNSGPPVPVIESATVSRRNFTFSWSTTPNSSYQVQYKTNLTQTLWQNLGAPIQATEDSLDISDVATNSQRFYRVVLTP